MKLTSYVHALTLFLASVCVTFAVPSTSSGQTQSHNDQSKATGSARLVAQSGLSGGIVVALDFSDGKAVADLQADGNFVVHGLFATEASVEKARREIAQAGRYGQVSFDTYNGRDLPYIDNLVNLVLCKASCKVPVPELMRVVAPGGTVMESILAKSLADGRTLWTAEGRENYKKSPDLFLADGLVWSRDLKGRDPKTGKVVRTLVQEMTVPMAHDRYEVRGYPPGRNLPDRGRRIDQLELYSVFSGRYAGITETESKSAIPAMGLWEQRWKTPTPFAGHAIVASENTVMAAGVPMLRGYSVDDTSASYAGEKGGIAWLLDAKDGRKLQELRFDAPPVWDGIAISHAGYYVCLKDGSVVCLSGKGGI